MDPTGSEMLTAIGDRYDVFGDRTFILVRSYPVPTHSICMTVVVPSDHSESTRRELSTVSPSVCDLGFETRIGQFRKDRCFGFKFDQDR